MNRPNPLYAPKPPGNPAISTSPAHHALKDEPKFVALFWILNFILPGFAFFLRGGKVFAKLVGSLFIVVWLLLVAGGIYSYFAYGIKELGLFFVSSPIHLEWAEYGVYLVTLFWSVAVLIGTIFICIKAYNVKRWKKIIMMVVSIVSILGLTAGSAWAGTTIRNVRDTLLAISEPINVNPTDTPTPVIEGKPVWGDAQRINVMLLGSDQGKDRTGIRPDIIMVASINTKTGETQLFNLPRNLHGAYFPAGSPAAKANPYGFAEEEGLINGVWTYAEENPNLFPGADNPGLEATKDIVGETLGLDINYYAVVNMQGFVDLVNTLGGVTVNVPRDLPKGKTGDLNPAVVKAGQNRTLNGDDALWFVRSRADSDDYDRILRQRCMIGALTSEISGEKIATNLPSLLQNLRENFFTDIQQKDIKDWVELFDKVGDHSIQGVAFTNEVISPSHPNFAAIKKTVKESIESSDRADTPSDSSSQSSSTSSPGSSTEPPTPSPEPTSPSTGTTAPPVVQKNPYC
jgi:LCP family protein required for cell wall assembly